MDEKPKTYKLASELKVGDTIIEVTGRPVKILKISKGFYRNSLLIDFGGPFAWSDVKKDDLIEVVE